MGFPHIKLVMSPFVPLYPVFIYIYTVYTPLMPINSIIHTLGQELPQWRSWLAAFRTKDAHHPIGYHPMGYKYLSSLG